MLHKITSKLDRNKKYECIGLNEQNYILKGAMFQENIYSEVNFEWDINKEH